MRSKSNKQSMASYLMDQLCCFLLLSLVGIGMSCNENATQSGNPNLSLKLGEVGVTEAWIHFESLSATYGGDVVIKRDGNIVLTLNRATLDTMWWDNSLLPHHTYTYKAYKKIDLNLVDESNILAVTTMDTTSHNFTWQIDTLGDGNGSVLRDISIINETCMIAVGEIHVKDSLGGWDPTTFNVARWNGSSWAYSVGASVPFNAVFAFSDSDIWAATSAPYHYDGTAWRGYDVTGLFDGYVTKIWGTSSDNVYMVGTNGAIMHFDGTAWARMSSGLDVDLLDVWGSPDGDVIWACGYYRSKIGTYLLRFSGAGWEVVYNGGSSEFRILADTISGALTGVFAVNSRRVFIGGTAGIYIAPTSTHGEGERISFTDSYFPGFPNALRGRGLNDIFIVGDYDFIAHFNGRSWMYFDQFRVNDGRLTSVGQIEGLVVAVGYSLDPINSKGIVFRGRR